MEGEESVLTPIKKDLNKTKSNKNGKRRKGEKLGIISFIYKVAGTSLVEEVEAQGDLESTRCNPPLKRCWSQERQGQG